MTMMTPTQNEQPVSGGFRVDVSRGQRIGRVSSEWFSRPDDERYLNLPDLYDAVRSRAERLIHPHLRAALIATGTAIGRALALSAAAIGAGLVETEDGLAGEGVFVLI